MAAKMTFYEALGVPTDATSEVIEAAHRSRLDALQAEQGSLSLDEYSYRRTLLKLAWETLSDPSMRKSYDDKLDLLKTPATNPETMSERPPVGAAVEPLALAQRAEALSLRAEAMSLHADAMSIRADASALNPEGTARPLLLRIGEYAKSSLRSALMVLGAVMAMSLLGQFAFMYFAAHGKAEAQAEAASAEEKIVIQEYYQTYGVRPASAAEARLLMAEQERKEREQRAAEREQQRIEEEARRFKEESRRIGDQVSEDLRRAEERMQREKEQEKARQAEAERNRIAAEEERLQREQEKWRKVLAE